MKLASIAANNKCWVVRPGTEAMYFEHFRQHSIAALGHMDHIAGTNEGRVVSQHIDEIEKRLRAFEAAKPTKEQKSSQQTTAKITQIKTFISEINVGDVIFALSSNHVLVGTVLSPPYIANGRLQIRSKNGEFSKRELQYQLRRDIKWEEPRSRNSLPLVVRASITAQQSLFSLNHHSELINHWLYSIFISNDVLYFSTKISQQQGISQFHIAEFQRVIQKLELIAAKICEEGMCENRAPFDCTDFLKVIDSEYVKRGMADNFTLVTKNSFLSPGNMWSNVTGSKEQLVVFSMLLGSMFSVNVNATDENTAKVIEKHQDNVMLIAEQFGRESHFKNYQEHLQATLDKPNKSIINTDELISNGKSKKSTDFVFPETKENGDIGL